MVVHPQIVMPGHLAGCAASKQGKFIEFRHAWWEKAFAPYAASHDPSKLGESTIMDIAKDLKLDMAKFKADMDSPACKAQIQGDMAELAKWKVNATPSFFMNGQPFRWNGSPDATGFKPQIDVELQKVQASGVPCGEYYDKEVMGKGEKQFRSSKDPKPS